MAANKKPIFKPHEELIMKLRQVMNDLIELDKEVYFFKINGVKPSEHLAKAKDCILLCIKTIQNV